MLPPKMGDGVLGLSSGGVKPAGAGGASVAGASEEETITRRREEEDEAGRHGMAMELDDAAESFMWPVPIRVEVDWAKEREE